METPVRAGPAWRRAAAGVALASAWVAGGAGASLGLAALAGGEPPVLPLFCAVVLAGLLHGAVPGMAGALLSGVLAAPVLPGLAQLGGFLALGALVSAVAGSCRRARRDAESGQARLRGALEAAGAGAWEWDAVTGRDAWPEQSRRAPGAVPPPCQLSCAACLQAAVPEDLGRVAAAMHRAAAEGAVLDLEWRAPCPDGGVRWRLSRGGPVRNAGGAVVGYRGICVDVTAHRGAAPAPGDVQRRQEDFLAVLSHELRNPLAPLKNCLHVLSRAAPGSEQARRAQAVAERQVDHMARLVDDLLDATRVAHGKVALRLENVELGTLVRRAAEDHGPQFAQAGVELAVDGGAGAWVRGDPARLAQVVGNLLHNAAKFTPRGGRVDVAVLAEGGRARVRVRDTGLGIDPALLPRLFQPFCQLEATRAASRGGLGLGLSLVRELVARQGGSVTAASDGPGRGATFTVELPLEAPPPPPEPPRPEYPAGGPRRVLVVEDNVDAADTLRDALELDGHTVAVAYAGPEGVARAREFRPEVVLCDIGLPGMDGYQVAQALRAEAGLEAVQLVALTGHADPEDVQRARAAGFDHHLAKPPALADLERVMGQARGA